MKKLNLLLFIATMILALVGKSQIVITSNTTNISCNGICNGGISLSVSGGVGSSYSYSWNNGANTSFNDSLCAGNYTVTVTDGGGNTETATIAITEPSPITILADSINYPSDSICDGSIAVNATGGQIPYSFLWSTGQTTTTAVNLCDSSTYHVTVTDANGCTTDSTYSFNYVPSCTANFSWQLNAANDSLYLTDISTGGSHTSAWTYPFGSGNTPNLSFPIPNSSTSVEVCLNIYSTSGCTDSICKTINIDTTSNPITITINQIANSYCYGDCVGGIIITASGGIPPYSYMWSNGYEYQNVTGLCAGEYNLTVTDAVGNIAVSSPITITEPTQLLASITNYTNVLCSGGADGSATVNATGSMPPYTYTWNTTTGNSPTAINLPAGTYTVTINDANNCNAWATVVISQPSPLATTGVIQNVTTIGGSDGSAELFTTGGTAPYSYIWTNGINTTTALVENLSSGEYTCNISDSRACMLAYSFEIYEPWDTAGGPIVATLTANQLDTCLAFDIDSFYIDHITVDDINHIVTAYWVFTGNGDTATFPIEYEYTTGGNTIITLTFHCGSAKALTTYQSYIRIYSAIAINELNATVYQIYPNPASDYIKISNLENKKISIQIIDLNGKVLINESVSNEPLNIKQLKSGIYNLRIGNYSHKLVKL